MRIILRAVTPRSRRFPAHAVRRMPQTRNDVVFRRMRAAGKARLHLRRPGLGGKRDRVIRLSDCGVMLDRRDAGARLDQGFGRVMVIADGPAAPSGI